MIFNDDPPSQEEFSLLLTTKAMIVVSDWLVIKTYMEMIEGTYEKDGCRSQS